MSAERISGLRIRSRGRLPHWETEQGIYFVTFRLYDSLPAEAVRAIEFERQGIVQTAKQMGRDLSTSERIRLARLFTEKIERLLNAGIGSSCLKSPQVAQLVVSALEHFDGTRYRLFAWCVMPNHVHLVFQTLPGEELATILRSIKTYTARRANALLRRRGPFWQREYYDHLIRDDREFVRIVAYVADNPAKAGLKNWPWVETC